MVTTAKPFAEQAITFLTTTEPALLGQYALALVAGLLPMLTIEDVAWVFSGVKCCMCSLVLLGQYTPALVAGAHCGAYSGVACGARKLWWRVVSPPPPTLSDLGFRSCLRLLTRLQCTTLRRRCSRRAWASCAATPATLRPPPRCLLLSPRWAHCASLAGFLAQGLL